MLDLLYIVQLIGGALSIIVSLGLFISAFYSAAVDTPKFLKRLTGQAGIERKLDEVHDSIVLSHHLHLQQAEEFNALSELVFNEHDIPENERPYVSTWKIRRYVMNETQPDFSRNGVDYGLRSDDRSGMRRRDDGRGERKRGD